MNTTKLRYAALAVSSVLLAACGGGDDADDATTPTAPVAATAEGFWVGNSSTGVRTALAILENGETWGVYASSTSILGALYGNTTSNGTSLTGAGSDFNIPSRSVSSATYSGSYTPKAKINVNTSGGISFAGTYDTDYDRPASLTSVAGNFSGQGVSGSSPVQGVSVNISSTGVVTVPSTLGCSASGSIAPRPSGKNVFNVSMTFFGAACALGNGATARGIAVYDSANRELLVLALNPAKTDGFIYVGSR